MTDDGIGIPEADLPRIFERFYRVDKARSRQMGGTGLGLAIVKHLTQAMQGGVQASSRVGQGATFTVRLPRADEEREGVRRKTGRWAAYLLTPHSSLLTPHLHFPSHLHQIYTQNP